MRSQANSVLEIPPEALDADQHLLIRNLGITLVDLARLKSEQGSADCVDLYEEAIHLAALTGDRNAEAIRTLSLGHVYLDVRTVRNLERAEQWYRRSLELQD